MSGGQSSSTGASPSALDISVICSPSDQTPKPQSHFPLATWDMYSTYIAFWYPRIEKYNTFAASCRFYYENFPAYFDDERQSVLQFVAKQLSDAKEALLMDLKELEQRLESGGIGSDGVCLGGVGNRERMESTSF